MSDLLSRAMPGDDDPEGVKFVTSLDKTRAKRYAPAAINAPPNTGDVIRTAVYTDPIFTDPIHYADFGIDPWDMEPWGWWP